MSNDERLPEDVIMSIRPAYRKGDSVVIRKGAEVRSTHPQRKAWTTTRRHRVKLASAYVWRWQGQYHGERDKLLLEVERLRGALRKYGRHTECARSHRGKYRKPEDIPADDKPCTCGLDSALTGDRGTGGEDE